jgi:hypothetical protein
MSTQPVLDLSAQVRAVVETPIRDLTRLGMERETAACLLASQAVVRIVDVIHLQGPSRIARRFPADESSPDRVGSPNAASLFAAAARFVRGPLRLARAVQPRQHRRGSCPEAWCNWRCVTAITGMGRAGSACDCGQVDGWIIAQGSDCFQGHVAGALDRPFVVLLEQDGSRETHDGVLVGVFNVSLINTAHRFPALPVLAQRADWNAPQETTQVG